jgi:hypothetical protein
MPARSRAVRAWGLAGALYSSLAIAYCWPLLKALGSVLPNDTGDPGLIAFVIWWNAHAVPFTERWWSAPMFSPLQGALAFSDTLLGLSPFTSPMQWMGMTAVQAHNVMFVCSIITAALAAHALARQLTGRHDVAVIAGLAFGFAPYRAAQIPHLQLLVTAFMPLGLLALHKYLESSRRGWLVVFGVSWLVNGLISGYYLVFYAVLVALWLLWFVRQRRHWIAILLTLVLASAPFAPLLIGHHNYQAAYDLKRSRAEVEAFSADLRAFWAAPPTTWLAPSWTFAPGPEGELYPGAIVVMLTLAGITASLLAWWRRDPWFSWRRWTWQKPPTAGWYACGAIAMVVLALGPVAKLSGVPFMSHAPYGWLMAVPGGDSLRVPARFGMLAFLCLSQTAALALARFTSGRRQPALVVLLAAGIAADGWLPHMPVATVPTSVSLAGVDVNAVVLEVPMRNTWSQTAAMLRATRHGHPVVNGFSGYGPPHLHVLEEGLGAGDVSVIAAFRQLAPLVVIVNHDDDPDGAHERFISRAPDARLLSQTPIGPIYQFAYQPRPLVPTRVLPVANIEATASPQEAKAMIDGWMTTMWKGGPQTAGMRITIALEHPDVVSRIEMDLGSDRFDYPRGLGVDAVDEHGALVRLWEGGTAGNAISGILANWRRAPLTIDLPPTRAAALMLTLTADDPNVSWTVTELRVFGPQPR